MTQTRTQNAWRAYLAALLSVALFVAPAFAQQGAATAQQPVAATAQKPAAATATLTAAEREAAARVSVETVREVTAALSAKEMQGRGTAQPGGERAARYIADRFQRLGLRPLGDAGA